MEKETPFFLLAESLPDTNYSREGERDEKQVVMPLFKISNLEPTSTSVPYSLLENLEDTDVNSVDTSLVKRTLVNDNEALCASSKSEITTCVEVFNETLPKITPSQSTITIQPKPNVLKRRVIFKSSSLSEGRTFRRAEIKRKYDAFLNSALLPQHSAELKCRTYLENLPVPAGCASVDVKNPFESACIAAVGCKNRHLVVKSSAFRGDYSECDLPLDSKVLSDVEPISDCNSNVNYDVSSLYCNRQIVGDLCNLRRNDHDGVDSEDMSTEFSVASSAVIPFEKVVSVPRANFCMIDGDLEADFSSTDSVASDGTVAVRRRSPRLTVQTSLGPVVFLVDTGAVNSFLSRDYISYAKHRRINGRFRTANGEPLQTLGVVSLQLFVGYSCYKQDFVVANMSTNLIGFDFLEENRLVLLYDPVRLIPQDSLIAPRVTTFHASSCSMSCYVDEDPFLAVEEGYREEISNASYFSNEAYCVVPHDKISKLAEQISLNASVDVAKFRKKFPPLFGDEPQTGRKILDTGVRCVIQLNGKYTLKRKYLCAERDKITCEEIVQELKDKGIVREARNIGRFAAPVVMVEKKAGPDGIKPRKRLCADFRDINEVTEPYPYPLPRIDSIKQTLKAFVFSAVDLKDAFHQVLVDEDSVKMTGMKTPSGLVEYIRMPFGLKNAPSHFQCHINEILHGLKYCCLAYIDDIMIFSQSYEDHVKHLETVLHRLNQYGMTINVEKSHFFQQTVKFLGLEIDAHGYRPPANYVPKIENFERPETRKGVQKFLGLINYYIKHMGADYQHIAEPLTKLTGRAKFEWGPEQERAFHELKERFKLRFKLTPIDFNLPYRLYTDASRIALGACLCQYNPDKGEEFIVDFYSKKLTATQQRYSVHTLEAFAVYKAIMHFRRLLLGAEFVVYTDHSALCSWFTKDILSERQARMLVQLQDFEFKIVYIKGEENVMADFASRPPYLGKSTFEELRKELDEGCINLVRNDFLEQIKEHTRDDFSKDDVRIQQSRVSFENGIYYYKVRPNGTEVLPLVPPSLRRTVIVDMHMMGHQGVSKCFRQIRSICFWPGMHAEIAEYIGKCHTCLTYKNQAKKRRPKENIICTERWRMVHMDIVGKLPATSRGNEYILTMIDRFTRWPHLIPMRKIDAEHVAQQFVYKWVPNHGIPECVITDQGPQFESKFFNDVFAGLGIAHRRTTPYHPQTNAMIERQHGIIKAIIQTKLPKFSTDWEHTLPIAEFILRTALNAKGVSPSILAYGEQMPMPFCMFRNPITVEDIESDSQDFLYKLSENMLALKNYILDIDLTISPYGKVEHKEQRRFHLAYVKNPGRLPPLAPKFTGPVVVLKVQGSVVTVQHPNGRICKVNRDNIKAVHTMCESIEQLENLPSKAPDFDLVKTLAKGPLQYDKCIEELPYDSEEKPQTSGPTLLFRENEVENDEKSGLKIAHECKAEVCRYPLRNRYTLQDHVNLENAMNCVVPDYDDVNVCNIIEQMSNPQRPFRGRRGNAYSKRDQRTPTERSGAQFFPPRAAAPTWPVQRFQAPVYPEFPEGYVPQQHTSAYRTYDRQPSAPPATASSSSQRAPSASRNINLQIKSVAPAGSRIDYYGEQQVFLDHNWTPANYERLTHAYLQEERKFEYTSEPRMYVRRPDSDGWVRTPKHYRESPTANAAPVCDWQLCKLGQKMIFRTVYREGVTPVAEHFQTINGQVHHCVNLIVHNHPAEAVSDTVLNQPPLTELGLCRTMRDLWINRNLGPDLNQDPLRSITSTAVIANGGFSQSEATRQYFHYPAHRVLRAEETCIPEKPATEYFEFSREISQLKRFNDVLNRWPAVFAVEENFESFNPVLEWALGLPTQTAVAETFYCVRSYFHWSRQIMKVGEMSLRTVKKSEYDNLCMPARATAALDTHSYKAEIKKLLHATGGFLMKVEQKGATTNAAIQVEQQKAYAAVYFHNLRALHRVFLLMPLGSCFPFGVPYRILAPNGRYEIRHFAVNYLLMQGPCLVPRPEMLARIAWLTGSTVLQENSDFHLMKDANDRYIAVPTLSKQAKQRLFMRLAVWNAVRSQLAEFQCAMSEMADSVKPLSDFLLGCGFPAVKWPKVKMSASELRTVLELKVEDFTNRVYPVRVFTSDVSGDTTKRTIMVNDHTIGGEPAYVNPAEMSPLVADSPRLVTPAATSTPASSRQASVLEAASSSTSMPRTTASAVVTQSLQMMPRSLSRNAAKQAEGHDYGITVTEPLCKDVFPLVPHAEGGYCGTLEIGVTGKYNRVQIAADAPLRDIRELLAVTKGIVEQHKMLSDSKSIGFVKLAVTDLRLPGVMLRKDKARPSTEVMQVRGPVNLPLTFIVGHWKGFLKLPEILKPLSADVGLRHQFEDWEDYLSGKKPLRERNRSVPKDRKRRWDELESELDDIPVSQEWNLSTQMQDALLSDVQRSADTSNDTVPAQVLSTEATVSDSIEDSSDLCIGDTVIMQPEGGRAQRDRDVDMDKSPPENENRMDE